MNESKFKIRCETEGFEEAAEEVRTLADAYDGFPAQVVIRNCKDCTINVYPSQIQYADGGRDDQD